MSNHEPENGAEKSDHCARGECDPSLFLYSGLGYAHYRWHGGISCCFLNPIKSDKPSIIIIIIIITPPRPLCTGRGVQK